MAAACPGTNSQGLATILDPFRTIFADLGPDRQMSAVETGQMSSVARTDICLVSTHNVEVSEVSIVAISQCSSLR